jgi:hypothetical protein
MAGDRSRGRTATAGSRFRAEIVIENEEIEDLHRTLPDDVQTVIAEHKYNWMSVYKHLLQADRQEAPCGMVSQWHQQRHGQPSGSPGVEARTAASGFVRMSM